MINSIDEAIAHAKEKAEELNAHADYYRNHNMPEYLPSCLGCAREHEQLAEWLTELQERREADRWIPVSERLPEKDGVYLVTIQYVAKYEKGSPIHTIELLASYYTKYGKWSLSDNVIAWRNLPKPYESEDK